MKDQRNITIQKIIKKRLPSFPQKLEEMLKSNKHYDCLCWSEDGSEIIIKNKDALAQILPLYFKTHKYSSFHRQLHIFGFKQMKNELNQVMIYHPGFTHDQNQLQIKQKEIQLSLFGQHEKIKYDLSLILIQQQQLQSKVVILMQIQTKIQYLYQTMLKMYLQNKVIMLTRRNEHLRYILPLSRGFTETGKFGNEVLYSHREFIQSCFEQEEEEWMDDQQSLVSLQQYL